MSDPLSGNAPGGQRSPALAFDGMNYLVVWEDRRRTGDISFGDIYGAPSARPGACSTPAGSPSRRRRTTNWPRSPSTARTTSSPGQRPPLRATSDIYGARVSPGGGVLDGNGLAISTAAKDDHRRSPSTARTTSSHGRTALGQTPTSTAPASARPGSVLDGSGLAISRAAYYQGLPALAFDGTNYLVAWEDYRSDATPTSTAPASARRERARRQRARDLDGADDQSSPALAFDGTNYLVAWQDSRPARAPTSTAPVSARPERARPGGGLAISTAANDQSSPALAFDGTNYLVAWEDGRSDGRSDIYGARVSPAGSVLDPGGLAISTAASSQYEPALTFDGTNYLVAWQDYRSGTSIDIYGARVSPAGSVLDAAGSRSRPRRTSRTSRRSPSTARTTSSPGRTGAQGYWTDIYGARVSPAGSVLDGPGSRSRRRRTTSPRPRSPSTARTTSSPGRTPARDTTSDIYGARVSPGGDVLDPGGLAISTAAIFAGSSPALAFDGANYLVAWEDCRSGGGTRHLRRPRQPGGGRARRQRDRDLDRGELSVLARARLRRHELPRRLVGLPLGRRHPDIYGARVSPAGSVLDGGGIAISTAANWQYLPALAFDGANYLVAWEDYRSGTYSDIYGARVAQPGASSTAAGSRSRRRRTCSTRPRSPSTARTTSSPGRTTARARTTTSTAPA